ncbi:hypothetical protein [Rhizobium sp. RCAM05973]|uniref:hypothetical protein n=1 Tax=Rhizobium sp. RCAM05973 TaxID=2994066 RepID=UPI0022EBCFBE|nr:hypothetical protein [Rhizobium sp. RCAM05973]
MRILILSVGGRQLIIVDWRPARVERVGDPPCGDIRTFFENCNWNYEDDFLPRDPAAMRMRGREI